MEQGIGFTLAIQRRAARHGEPHLLIETHRLLILLVDVNQRRAALADGMFHQPATHATAAHRRRYKQHLYLAIA